MSKKVSIIGTGNVGSALGKALAAKGYTIVYGSRDPGSHKTASVVNETKGAISLSIPDAIKASEIVVLATPWAATQDAIKACGNLDGKIVIDATNPIGPNLTLAVSGNSSGGEEVAKWAGPGAKVVKAFNTIGCNLYGDPQFGVQSADLRSIESIIKLLYNNHTNCDADAEVYRPALHSSRFADIAGDDEGAKQAVAALAADLGFAPLDVGPLSQARYTEPLAMLWITLAYKQKLGRNHAFKLLRK